MAFGSTPRASMTVSTTMDAGTSSTARFSSGRNSASTRKVIVWGWAMPTAYPWYLIHASKGSF